MKVRSQRHDNLVRLAELVADFNACMMTTVAADAKLASRPMTPLELCTDCNFWFLTSKSSTKTHQLEAVNLSFTDEYEYNSIYVSVCGYGELVNNRRSIEAMWTPQVSAWFPDGKDDPDLALLMVTMEMSEYWDAHSSKMIRPLALLTSAMTAGEHEIVQNPHLIDLRQRLLMNE